jgi:replicative DNA helicase
MKYQELPQDIEAEKAIFSLILLTPSRFIEIVDLLSPNDFYSIYHQPIWHAMTELFKEGKELDIVAIRSEIKKHNVDSGPIMTALLEAFESSVFGGNLLHFVKIVKDKSLLRQITAVAQSKSYDAQLEGADPHTLLSEFEKDILDIADRSKDAKAHDAPGIITEINADIAKIQETGWKGYNTGFAELDAITGGLIPTQSWIIGAYTGVGKTFFILQTLLNVLEQGGKVMLFSTEMDRKMNILRMLGNLAGLGTINMMRGNMLANEKEEYEKAIEKVRGWGKNLIIYDNVYTIAEIRLKAKKAKIVNEGLDVIAVDFIQNLRGKESIYERMSEAAVSLQQLAQELECTMIIGSQVSQQAAGWQSKEAIEFKGAGEIAAIADVAIWLQKSKEDQNVRNVLIRKIRHGAPGKFQARLSFPSGRFVDMNASTPQEQRKESQDNVKDQLQFGE